MAKHEKGPPVKSIPAIDGRSMIDELRRHFIQESTLGESFRNSFAAETVYGLPHRLIEIMKALPPKAKSRSLLPAGQELDLEVKLADICKATAAVGLMKDAPVFHPYAAPDWIPAVQMTGKVGRRRATVETLTNRRNRLTDLMTAYLGWLKSDPTFTTELVALRQQWPAGGQLPQLRPLGPVYDEGWTLTPTRDNSVVGAIPSAVPIGRHVLKVADGMVISVPEAQLSRKERPAPATAYAASPDAMGVIFCRRWSLMRMATWDLPEPVGLLFADGVDPILSAVAGLGQVLFVPRILREGAQFNVGEWLDDEAQECPPHLAGWLAVLTRRPIRRSVRPIGLKGYQDVFLLSHLLHVLQSRYPRLRRDDRDDVLGRYLGGTASSIAKLRTALRQNHRQPIL